jgi:hypothetical protein
MDFGSCKASHYSKQKAESKRKRARERPETKYVLQDLATSDHFLLLNPVP